MRLNKPMMFLLVLIGAAAWSGRIAAAPAGKAKLAKPAVVDAAIMDVNQIECYIQNNGKIGENPTSGGDGFFYPKGQRNASIIFTGGIWVLGKVNGDIRTACADYSTEYQPGMILPDGNPDDATKPEYKIYTYNKGDAIDQVAIDQGCPTSVLGDKMMFSVFNDVTDHTVVFTKPPIGLEVTLTAFGFNQTGAMGNTLFYKFKFTNKGAATLDSAFVAVFFDPDLGDGNDDFVGCDTDLGIGYVFNGDNYDTKYGTAVPSMGCDFFQGPIVDAPGESAVLPDGTVLADKKILQMTSFFAYINGAPITGMGDPSLQDAQGAQEAYFFVNGFRGNGEPWTNPVTGLETKFPFDGDPILNTGWLMASITAPKDMRMGLSAGPFTLAQNDPKEVVIGLVVGQGADNMSSVAIMKYYDKQAQAAYDKNFDLASPPPVPQVTVAQADEDLMLIWDKASSVFSDKGYNFEGYNIWQGASQAGPWTRVATIDQNNLVTTIWDDNYSAELATVLNMPVQFGADTGLRYNFFVEKDYLSNTPLINGRHYYFAVTGYAYNPDGVPKTLENAPTGILAVPQKPVLNTEYKAAMLDTIPAPIASGVSDGKCIVSVMDPAAITGHDYEVSFSTIDDTLSTLYGQLVWHLTDKTTGQAVLQNQLEATAADPEKFQIVDGLKVKVSGAAPTFKAIIEVANEAGPLPPAKWDAAGKPFGGDNVWHALSPAGFADRHYVSGGGGTGGKDRLERWIGYAVPRDFEIRFTEAGGWGVFAFDNDMVATTPFEIWDIGISTPNDPSDDVRMIPFMTNSTGDTRSAWSPVSDVDPYFGYNASDWIYWMDPQDANGYNNFAAVCASTGAGNTYPYATDGSEQGYFANFYGGFVYPIGRFILGDYNDDGTGPLTGTVIRVLTGKPNNDGVKFAFSTAGVVKEQSADVAAKRLSEINVYPNPYFGHSTAEGNFFEQIVTFNNLPEQCTIRIFSISGQLVRTLVHDDGTPFARWNLQNEERLPIASGMFIVHIETAFGEKILKLGVINREQRYLHM
jgi:hypothetical protein